MEAGGGDALQQDRLAGVEGDQGAGGVCQDGGGIGRLGMAEDDRVLGRIEAEDGVLAEADIADQKGGRPGGRRSGWHRRSVPSPR